MKNSKYIIALFMPFLLTSCYEEPNKLYNQTIDFADELIVSEFPVEVEGDVFFPKIDNTLWEVKNEKIFNNFTLITYKRK